MLKKEKIIPFQVFKNFQTYLKNSECQSRQNLYTSKNIKYPENTAI